MQRIHWNATGLKKQWTEVILNTNKIQTSKAKRKNVNLWTHMNDIWTENISSKRKKGNQDNFTSWQYLFSCYKKL